MSDERSVEIGQGRMLFHTWGDGGDPVVLLHPLALSGALWEPLATRLADEFAVHAPDQRGHGGTSWDGQPFTLEDMADDLAQALDGLGTGPVHLLGMSMGGGVAMAFAARHPDRVRSLVLADTTAWYGPNAVTAWADRAQKAATVPRDKQVGFQVDRWYSEGYADGHQADVDRVVRIFEATNSQAHAAACGAMGAFDARDRLPSITARTLVLVGEYDYATPPDMARVVADGIPDATLRVLTDLRHLSLIERPELADEVRAHFAGRPAATR